MELQGVLIMLDRWQTGGGMSYRRKYPNSTPKDAPKIERKVEEEVKPAEPV
eukprot:CAMPEP_0168316454 /NCGR_PEP_ID=MMETSP0210-20121227/15548_1 /TAXON_ID=40633 /ORGANISM="Condylostoma magnum, Strain COL2" /LENGTH=50 /DNA_ID=CAMNT_0008297209 /DNA_START=282 /DNA_END=433 /DNA_ORIENTATION=-